MEKRLLFAVVLSFLILYSWSRMTGPVPQNQTKKTQTTEYQELIENSDPLKTVKSDVVFDQKQNKAVEQIETIENDSLRCEFSNVGGSLQTVYIKDFDKILPITELNSLSQYRDYVFELESNLSNNINYRLTIDGLKIEKSYALDEKDHTLLTNTTIENVTNDVIDIDVKLIPFIIDMSSLDNSEKSTDYNRNKNLFEYALFFNGSDYRKNKAYRFKEKKNYQTDENVQFAAFRDRYYCAIFKPQYNNRGALLQTVSEKIFRVSLLTAEKKISAGEILEYNSFIYVGPEKIDVLKKYDKGLERIQKFYKLGIFDLIAKVIFKLLHLIHLIIPNWGLSIILVSLVIYFSTYPLTMKSMRSMKKMQALQPKINSLKEKHKNNPQKMNIEVMELYKKHKINPLGGCLPMLLQMPVFIGLYQVLWRAVDFKGAPFLWIKDLSMPDRMFLLPMELPIIGNEFNVLPLIMMVVMFFQQKISAKNMNVTDPAQLQQQKMMTTIFPLFLGFIFYRFASGLTLYFTMFYILSTFTQYKLSKAHEVIDG